jgi:HSP20 family protein
MADDSFRTGQPFFFLPVGQAVSTPSWEPPIDVYRTRRGWLVKIALAGVRPEDVELSASGNRLHVRGTRRDFCLEEGCHQYRMEIAYSHFERTVTLPVTMDKMALSVEHRYGLLLVHIQTEAGK